MKKIIYYFWTLAAIFIFTSCGNDNYDAPAETFQGAFIDKDTNEPIQTAASTAIEHGGIRIRLMEYSWSDNPVPYDFLRNVMVLSIILRSSRGLMGSFQRGLLFHCPKRS